MKPNLGASELRDRHVLITGGSSGIGLALARRCAAAGARVSLMARDAAKLAIARDAIAREYPSAPAVAVAVADVAVEAEVLGALASAMDVHGTIDVLITSAGVAEPGYFDALPVDAYERAIAVNYFGSVYLVKAVVPGMKQRGRGAVALISSGVGLVGLFGYTAYAPSKFALRGFAESLRAELVGTGVHLSIAYPPDTETPQLAAENLTKPFETKALTENGGVYSADYVADSILAGLASRKFAITPGFQMTALRWLHSIVGPLLSWAFDREVRKARRRPTN